MAEYNLAEIDIRSLPKFDDAFEVGAREFLHEFDQVTPSHNADNKGSPRAILAICHLHIIHQLECIAEEMDVSSDRGACSLINNLMDQEEFPQDLGHLCHRIRQIRNAMLHEINLDLQDLLKRLEEIEFYIEDTDGNKITDKSRGIQIFDFISQDLLSFVIYLAGKAMEFVLKFRYQIEGIEPPLLLRSVIAEVKPQEYRASLHLMIRDDHVSKVRSSVNQS